MRSAGNDQGEIGNVIICVSTAAGGTLITAVKAAGGQRGERGTFEVGCGRAHAGLVDDDSRIVQEGDPAVIRDPSREVLVWGVNAGAGWRGQKMLSGQKLNTGRYSQQR